MHAVLLEGFRARSEALRSWTWDYFTKSRASALIDRPDAARIDWTGHDPTPFPTSRPSESTGPDRDVGLTESERTLAARIEDYAIIGDTKTVALVDCDGSIDWWCVPRVDSGACFAALLGKPEHGRWLLRPKGEVTRARGATSPRSLVLETEYETPTGTAVGHRLHVAGRGALHGVPHRRRPHRARSRWRWS